MTMRMIRIIDIKNNDEVIMELPYNDWKGIITCLRAEDQGLVQKQAIEISKVDMLMFLKYFRDEEDVSKVYEVALMLYWTASNSECHRYNIRIDEVKR